MITTSQAWKEYSRDVGIFHIKAVIDNGTQMTLTDEDFMQGSVSITDSISGMSDFTVGAVITNSFNATLNNFSGKFNNYNLAGATISVQFGIIFDDETEEWIDRGTYTLEKPTSLGSTIKVVGYDDMDKLNRYYIGKDANNNDITFPLDCDELAEILCNYCGVTFGSWDLYADAVDEFEYDESTTCRQVLSWIVQSFGGYARINPQGTLDCKKFNANAWTIGDEVQGGVINPWGGAGTVSGGGMNPWSAVTDYDGGEDGNIDFTLSKIKSLNVYVEDIAVTGVRAYAYNTVDEFQFDTVGTGGYVLAIQDNPLVTDNTLAVATRVYNATKDIKFRPFDASIIGDPSIEAGDIIALQDYLGNAHVSLITSLTYSVNSAERLECNAKTPEEADLETANPQTSVIKGATMAAYDYILAKKISADYISAGTITGAVEATNFTMTGGSINVEVETTGEDIIRIKYDDGSREVFSNMSATGVGLVRNSSAQNGVAGASWGTGNKLGLIVRDNTDPTLPTGKLIFAAYDDGEMVAFGDPMIDSVIEEGTWGSYGWWRKWHSGKAEVHGYASVTTAINTPYQGVGYYTSQTVTFPTGLFVNGPVINITLERNGGLIFPSIRASSKDNVNFFIASLASEASATVWFHVNAFGKWK